MGNVVMKASSACSQCIGSVLFRSLELLRKPNFCKKKAKKVSFEEEKGEEEKRKEEKEKRDALDPRVLIEEARKEYGFEPQEVHLGVVGGPGVGKSSFIKFVCHCGSQSACDVEEHSNEIRRHQHHLLTRINLWDIPSNSIDMPLNDYFMEKKLYAFDVIFILSSDVFSAESFGLAKLASKFQRRYVFIRTKVDVAIKQLMEELKVNALEASERLREITHSNITKGLQQHSLPDTSQTLNLFLISSKHSLNFNPYAIIEADGKISDSTLQKMDEDKMYRFLSDLTKTRRVKTFSKTRVDLRSKQESRN